MSSSLLGLLDLPAEDIPAVLGELERVKATLWARLMTPAIGDGHATPSEDDRLLTVEKVADRLGLTKAYVYELIRRGTLPATRIGNKYVRVSSGTLHEWIVQEPGKSLDRDRDATYRAEREGRRASATPQAVPFLTGGPGGRRWRNAKLHRATGTRPSRHQRTSGVPASPADVAATEDR